MEKTHKGKVTGFAISKLPQANPTNPRGTRTWEWKMPEGTQVGAYKRIKDEFFANHFHKGDDPSKKPELFLLLSGILQVEFLDVEDNYSREILDAKGGPIELVIQPWILHRMKAIEECIYVEYRKTIFNPKFPDTYPAEEFLYQFKD